MAIIDRFIKELLLNGTISNSLEQKKVNRVSLYSGENGSKPVWSGNRPQTIGAVIATGGKYTPPDARYAMHITEHIQINF